MSSDYLEKDVVYVNSSKRISGVSSSNFTIDLSNQITKGNSYDTATLLNFTCPKSYYIFTSNNNRFVVTENGTSYTITIPIGNYDIDTLNTQLNSSLTNAVSGVSYTYTVENSKRTGHYEITVSNNSGVQPIFDFNTRASAYAVLGFNKTTYQFSNDFLESVNIVNLQKTNTIQLCCDFVDKGILADVIPNTGDFGSINYTEYNSNFASQKLIKTDLSSANFYLLDGSTGNYLNLNGLDYSFTFVIYKKNSYYQHMIEDRKMELLVKDLEMQLKSLEESKAKLTTTTNGKTSILDN